MVYNFVDLHESKKKNDVNFNSLTFKNAPWLIFVKMDGCYYCDEFKKEIWDGLRYQLPSNNVSNTLEIERAFFMDNKDKMGFSNVENPKYFPFVFFYCNGIVVPFQQKRTRENLVRFVNSNKKLVSQMQKQHYKNNNNDNDNNNNNNDNNNTKHKKKRKAKNNQSKKERRRRGLTRKNIKK